MTDIQTEENMGANLASGTGDDVMKDFNFDDILENPSNNEEVVSSVEGTGGFDMPQAEQNYESFDNVGTQDDYANANADADVFVSGDDYSENVDLSATGGIVESPNIGFLREYDGGVGQKMYSISKDFKSDNFNATTECDTIHINVGYDTYGWNVQFANGVNMSLRDVKEYQKRQGRLPFNAGDVVYGGNVLQFSGVKRIVVYESVKYFSYGA